MIKTITYITVLFLLFVNQVIAQEQTFEQKMKQLSIQIEEVVKLEKELLKKEIKTIEKAYNNDEITFEEAKSQKEKATQLHANNIKIKTGEIEEVVHDLVQGKVDVKVKEYSNPKQKNVSINWSSNRNDSLYKYKRTFSSLVVAFGFNNLMKDGNINSINDSDFKFSNSRFLELGINYKTRILKNTNGLYANYGLSLRYNTLKAKDNQYLVPNNNHTTLETYPLELKQSKFRNLQLVVPAFFEIDLSKSKEEGSKTYYGRNASWRLGFGGFAGFNLKSKQVLKYDDGGRYIRQKIKTDYNVNNFVYGVQALIGYRSNSFYVKYDLQDTFAHDFKGQKNVSFGVRFDL